MKNNKRKINKSLEEIKFIYSEINKLKSERNVLDDKIAKTNLINNVKVEKLLEEAKVFVNTKWSLSFEDAQYVLISSDAKIAKSNILKIMSSIGHYAFEYCQMFFYEWPHSIQINFNRIEDLVKYVSIHKMKVSNIDILLKKEAKTMNAFIAIKNMEK